MRWLGGMLMTVGFTALAVGLLAAVAPFLRSIGFEIVVAVTSVPGAIVGGAVFMALGAVMRRQPKPATPKA